MYYFFIKNATTQFGPINFPIYVLPFQTIAQKVDAEAKKRGVMICHDWTAEHITREECAEMMRNEEAPAKKE
jgi:hypothetical protein